MAAKILLNALHTTTGGGLIYLQNILPFLAADKRFECTLLIPAAGLQKIKLPKNIKLWQAPVLGFAAGHLWEQLVLPLQARAQGFVAMWCNANYVPLLAKNPVPTIHTTPRAAAQALSFGMRVYWLGVRWLTVLSLLRAPAALSVAQHVIADYASAATAKKVRVASPAAPVAGGNNKKVPGLIVAVGDYYPQKNYPTLLRAIKLLQGRLPHIKLELIGRPVDPAVAAGVRQLVADLHLQKTVKEVGPLPHARLLKKLGTANAFVSLSRAECFNMPVLEALSVGTPVLAGDYAFQHEVAADAALYVPLDARDTPDAVADALHGLLMNPALSAQLVRAGRARAAKFSWRRTAATISDTLAKVVTLG